MAIIKSFQVFFFVFTACFVLLSIPTQGSRHLRLSDKHVPIFFFGDSYFDVGNNNYINTSFRANYSPYGETFFKHSTGRFSDGRLISDFIAEYAELPLVPPYLQPGNQQFKYGANFASAGAGALVETSQGLVIDMQSQLSYFKSVKKSLRQKLGDQEAKDLLSRAVYLFSIGGNDYIIPFQSNSSAHLSYSHDEFVGLVIGNITAVIKEIYKQGGRNFGFIGLDPLGCLPYARALVEGKSGACFEAVTPYVKLHNQVFPKVLKKLESQLKGFRYSVTEIYEFLTERITHPSKYGFEEGKGACCGSGPYRGIYSCGGKRGVKEYELCQNVSEYVFFDSGHPTEKVFQQFAKQFWNGATNSPAPNNNLKALFSTRL